MDRLKLLTLLICLEITCLAGSRNHIIKVKAGDAKSLLECIAEANRRNVNITSERLYVLIPDGVYDLGETTLTAIEGHNVSLIGESMEGTVIVNAPKVENEGIGKTATLLNRGQNTYVQDLTLKNALDYYHSGAAGRAVCWQDKGNRTVFKRVRMLSYQDTYYSHSEECQHYFEDCEIHGTVDFLCGAGDVYFNRCLIVTEKRDPEGKEGDVIVAPRTSTTRWGYVFDHCTIRSDSSKFYLARGWHTLPRCTWLYTCIDDPEKVAKGRFDPYSIRSVDCFFYEYQTMDKEGNIISPQSNVVTYIKDDVQHSLEAVMTAEDAKRFSLKNIFPDWKPEKVSARQQKEALKLKRAYL